MDTDGLNTEVVNTVAEDDIPQKTRNEIHRRERNGNIDARMLKFKVNNFLWNELPMKTSIREAEILSCKIFDLVLCQIDK